MESVDVLLRLSLTLMANCVAYLCGIAILRTVKANDWMAVTRKPTMMTTHSFTEHLCNDCLCSVTGMAYSGDLLGDFMLTYRILYRILWTN